MPRWVLPLLALLAAPSAPLGAAPTEADTVLAVRRGQVLVGDGFAGRVTLVTWSRDQIELVEETGEGRVALRQAGDRITLTGTGRGRGGGDVRLRVPAWLPVQLRGTNLSASVDGLTAVVDLFTVEGDLECTNVSGDVFASSVEGTVTVSGASGRLRLRSVEETVIASRVDAESVLVESTSGDIVLDGVSAASVDASTTDGDVTFTGALRTGGQYRLSTHDGDLIVTLPAATDAQVTVSTFDGAFVPEFPITLERFQGGKELSFTLGRGGARLALNAFDGDIRLRRR